jgi:hypothetical protein
MKNITHQWNISQTGRKRYLSFPLIILIRKKENELEERKNEQQMCLLFRKI